VAALVPEIGLAVRMAAKTMAAKMMAARIIAGDGGVNVVFRDAAAAPTVRMIRDMSASPSIGAVMTRRSSIANTFAESKRRFRTALVF
jgi:hypothetical protein